MSTHHGFFGYMCARRLILEVIHALLWIALILNTISAFVIMGNPETEVVIAFNYAGILTLLMITGYLAWKCRRLAEPGNAHSR